MIEIKRRKKQNNVAQSIIELSLLGAALLGILGLLVRYATGISDAQNTQLRAMRQAMILSATEGFSNGSFPTSSSVGDYLPRVTDNRYKQGHRKNATVLWIDDRPTIEGGEKYGSSSVTPTMSFGSASLTSIMEYPVRYGDPSQIPLFDMYINGKHFSFSTFGYRYVHFQRRSPSNFCSNPAPNGNKLPHCLTAVPLANGNMWWYSDPQPVAWMKIPRSDVKFCYAANDPSWHHCTHAGDEANYDHRFRLDPINGDPVPVAQRHAMQWQWYPVILNNAGINFFGGKDAQTTLDVDYDGHEETIMHYWQETPLNQNEEAYVGQSPCGADFSGFELDGSQRNSGENGGEPLVMPNTNACHHSYDFHAGGWTGGGAWVIDTEEGDLAMTYNTVDKLRGKVKPGFNQGKAKILTITTPAELKIEQQNLGTQGQYISRQKKNTVNIIEREIQLSNNTGRFDRDPDNTRPAYNTQCINNGVSYPRCYYFDGDRSAAPSIYSNENDSVAVSCAGCCFDPGNKYQTCFDTASKILYVRSLLASRTGHRYKTIKPLPDFP